MKLGLAATAAVAWFSVSGLQALAQDIAVAPADPLEGTWQTRLL